MLNYSLRKPKELEIFYYKNRKSGDIPNYLSEHVKDKDPNNFTELNSVYSDIKFEDLYYRKISL